MTDLPLHIAVLMGGHSAEAEVSRNSATQIGAALETRGHQVICLELDAHCPRALLDNRPDVVFPALHGPPGEDGTVQGLLEMLALPYVGSGVRGSALAMDKSVAKSIFAHHGLPVLEELVVDPTEGAAAGATRILSRFGDRVVIKPLNQGSAIGVTPLPDGGDVQAALSDALRYGACLIEPFMSGHEITVGVLHLCDEAANRDDSTRSEESFVAHPVIEICTASAQWYDYHNRYSQGGSEHIIPARLPDATNEALQRHAVAAHRALGLRDLSRADFIVNDEGAIALLEVNTLPGMTPTSLYPDGARHLGYAFEDLMDLLVRQAHQRRPR